MKILVTGGTGYIGSHLVEKLRDQNDVIVLSQSHERPISGVEYIEGSITERFDIHRACKGIDSLMHLAAMVSVPRSMDYPDKTLITNTVGTANLLQETKDMNISFLYVSSASIYGDAQDLPVKETHPLHPKSPYGVSKFASEEFCKLYMRNYNMDIKIARPFNAYGGNQNYENPYANVPTKFVKNAKSGKDLMIFGDGLQTRDFVHVEDICDAFIHVMKKQPDTYNIGSGQPTSIKTLAEKVQEYCPKDINIIYKEAEPGQILHSYADISRIKNTGWSPKITMDEGIRRLF